MEDVKELEVFRSAPVPQAVLKNTVPAMAAILMALIYNLADTLLIGFGQGVQPVLGFLRRSRALGTVQKDHALFCGIFLRAHH